MSRNFTCPHCQRSLVARDEYLGKEVRCPSCQQPFLLEVPQESAPDESPASSVDSPLVWKAYARDAGIDLHEKRRKRVSSESRAEDELADWKSDMPEVPSAYVPSGVLPMAAVAFMLLGSVVGVPAGALTGVLTAAIGGLLIAITFFIIAVIAQACGCVACISIVIAVMVVLVAYLLTFALIGVASGATVAIFGMFGKNRNVPVPALLSALSAAVATGVFWFPWEWWGARDLEKAFDLQPHDLDITYIICLVIGGIMAIIAAGFMARHLVHEMKFCEECEEYMEEAPLPKLRYGGLRAVCRALTDKDIPMAAALCQAPRGEGGAPRLFWCKHCDKGYIELTAEFEIAYKDKDKTDNSKDESWLVASVELDATQVALFKPQTVKPGEEETKDDADDDED